MDNIFTRFFGNGKTEQRNVPQQQECCAPFVGAGLFGQFASGYGKMSVGAVHRGVQLISNGVAALPIVLQSRSDSEKTYDNHPLSIFFADKDPSVLLTRFQLMKLLVASVIRYGNGYAYIHRDASGRAKKLQFIEYQDVTYTYDKYNPDKFYYQVNVLKEKKVKPTDLIDIKMLSNDGIRGISPLSLAARDIEISSNSDNAALSWFKSGSRLSGLLKLNTQAREEQKRAMLHSWNQAFADPNNGGIAVIDANADFVPISTNPKDSMLNESRLMNVSAIARHLGINPVLLGDTTARSSFSNLEDVLTEFLMLTLQPWITAIECEFNKKLVLPTEKDIIINIDEKALLKTNKTALASYIRTLKDSGVITTNECRRMLGLTEVDNGDKLTIAYSDIQQNTINTQD